MITVRYGEERGRANLGWLDSRHSFSFADYFDPKHMGFGPLRVINEDRVAQGAGFDTHGHRDMEIISYVLEGELAHKDSIGTGSVNRPGDVQRMTAGAGVRHSEFNHSKSAPVHFLQIWIMPDQQGLAPSYEQKHFADADKKGTLRLIASRDGRDGSVKIHQGADVFAALLDPGQEVSAELAEGRLGWLQVARGVVTLNGQELRAGDGAAIENERELVIASLSEGSEVLLFDLLR